MAKQFVHLHLHTEYSLLDGATRVGDIFKRCEELNMPAVAITDHGNMYGAVEFFKAAVKHTDPNADPYEFIAEKREFKIKPIIGCEVYMCPDMTDKTSAGGKMPKYNHLVLLAKNETGYKNLIKIVSRGFTEGLYYKPRIDFSCLEGHCEGLIALSACIAGIIPQCLLSNDQEGAQRYLDQFLHLFGEDFYIEIQDHNIRDQKIVLPKLIALARKNNVKLVATNDVHYLKKEDAKMQKMLQCISFRNTMNPDEEVGRKDLSTDSVSDEGYFPTAEFYMKGYDEMLELFPGTEDSLTTTAEVAAKCECNFFRKEPLLPSYNPDDGSEPYEYLRKLCYVGLQKKYKQIDEPIRQRAEYELEIIYRLGFVDYFLIVWDFIHYSETHDIPVGPGRGSGVGSIVAYAIGITKVDPLKYSLIFERFLNSERVSNPDFDIDFCVDKRDDVIKYVIEKYGENNVSQIVTFGTLAAKAAVKDVGRVYNYPYSEVEKITKQIPKMMGKNHIGHLIGLLPAKPDQPNPVIYELKEMYESDPMTKNIVDMAMKIEGMPRQTGMHAAGVIICRDEISMHVPMARSSENIVTTQFNMIECEELGLLKMDFLGLRTLTDIKKAIDIVKVTRGREIDFYSMEYDDAGVFNLISSGDTHAVFQLESAGMKRFMRDLRPTSLEDIIAGISLYRPGPMDKIPMYVENKKHPEKIAYDHPLLEPILKVSYGIMVYQEQVMQIVRTLGGYSLGRADIVRRMMSKKKKDAMEKERQVFLNGTVDKGTEISGCIKNGVSEAIANKVYDDMISFASYAFNKSHAAAYAFLAYQTAYLKSYYTVEFVTAVLNNRIASIEEITNYLTYLKERGFEVYPPNINKSYAEFTVENGGVRIGMAAIKNVGFTIIEAIVSEREKNGEFTDFMEFIDRMSEYTLNKKMLESLIFSGTFDVFKKTRATLMSIYESALDRATKDKKTRLSGQFSMFDLMDKSCDAFVYPDVPEYPLADKLGYEKSVAGVYLTGHPLEEYRDHLKTYKHNASMFLAAEESEETAVETLEENQTVTVGGMLVEAERRFTKNNKELGIGRIEDLYGTIEIMLSPYKLTQLKNYWVKDKLVSVTGKVSLRDESKSIWVESIEPWENASVKKSVQSKLCVYVDFKDGEKLNAVRALIEAYAGDSPAYIKDLSEDKLYAYKPVSINEFMLKELYGIVGESNIKVVK